MFGGAKKTFGAAPANTGFGFNNTAQTRPFPFIFGKPAINGFAQAPAFGQQNTSLFGAPQPTTGGRRSCGSRFFVPERPVFRRPRAAKPPRCKKNCSIRSIATTITTGGGLFGTNTAPAFGTTTTSQPAFRGFSQAPQNTSLLGSTTQQQPANTSLFSQGFGTQPKTTGFAFPQQSTSLFGQPTTSNAATAPAFVGGGFGQTNNANAGSSIAKYQETIGMDTLLKNGQTNSLSTKQHCITAMKEYESKSLEEIRMEDYLANRKGPQQGVGLFAQPQQAAGGLFGATSGQQSTGLFGQQQENKSLFGTNTMGTTPGFGQQPNTQQTGLFGNTATTSTQTAFGMGVSISRRTLSIRIERSLLRVVVEDEFGSCLYSFQNMRM